MNVTLIDRPATRVAFLRLLGRVRYGIAHDDPLVTAPEQCRYDACVELAADEPVSSTMPTTTLPAGCCR